MSPSMAYFESDRIVRGQNLRKASTAAMMAAISPTWLDCRGPGILIAAFLGWSGPTHIPLPQRAFRFPLLWHAPSVYTEIPRWQWFIPWDYGRL